MCAAAVAAAVALDNGHMAIVQMLLSVRMYIAIYVLYYIYIRIYKYIYLLLGRVTRPSYGPPVGSFWCRAVLLTAAVKSALRLAISA